MEIRGGLIWALFVIVFAELISNVSLGLWQPFAK